MVTTLLFTLVLLMVLLLALQIFGRSKQDSTEALKTLLLRSEQVQNDRQRYEDLLRGESAQSRLEASTHARENRTEVLELLQKLSNSILTHLAESQKAQNESLQTMTKLLADSNLQFRDLLERSVKSFQSEMSTKLEQLKEENSLASRRLRQETGESLKSTNETMLKTLESLSRTQGERLTALSENLVKLSSANEAKLEQVRATVEGKLTELRTDNATQLEQMRLTVDEKLQGTLEKRLGESFKQVSERLEQVHRGLGEMQALATGVGDLKKVLNNVKTRGGWGEVQLGALLDQMLTPAQFDRNVRTKPDSGELVEYGIRLPGRGEGDDGVVWLPIDSKFPIEDYQRLVEAQERGELASMEDSIKALRQRVGQCAKDISTKYLNPPVTTDFAIMFVPTEGLFAEIIRQPGLVEEMQAKYRVVLAGPTTFAALLNSLQMGFRTLSIQKQSSEVWKILGEVKTEFGRFGESLETVKKKLQEASKKMDDVGVRSRAVERRLRTIAELPLSAPAPAADLLDFVAPVEPELAEES